MRAYSKHQINQMHWIRTKDTLRDLRKKLIHRDCREKDKLASKIFNLRKSPGSLRTLLEEQETYEGSALPLEDQKFLNNSKFGGNFAD